ncbi:MAG: hypothetical protein UT42_C0033G0002 [Candidatus Falkowbacteria bacterium GW2011_GWA2_39_24]|uniref:Uncharacterized protein n=1 Tax=Candidatus Falkowbacteria bacterium GW2011_GWA2_39_24 TaxID=1618634 RepID=A0A0G0NN00_9BACT|nr:MAG: hypothetical protein UT42_C0033G0002 [Candidatus Falkowbacteria bacterium GW2011_GWA2_39_24]
MKKSFPYLTKMGWLICFICITIIALIYLVILDINTTEKRSEKKRDYIETTPAENRAIDSICFYYNNLTKSQEILMYNRQIYSRINVEVAIIYNTIFNKVIFINNADSESMALLSIVSLKEGLNLDNFAPQFKQYNPNKLSNAKTFFITIPAMKQLIKILNKKGALISGSEIIGEYIYII